MKVAIIVPRLVQLGPVLVIQALVNCLRNSEAVSVKVFYIDKKVDPEIKMLAPVELYSTRSLCFSDYDIIHTIGIRPDLIALINRRKIRCHISTIHNYVFEDLRFTYNYLISIIFGTIWLRLWRSADKLVCVTATMKNYYENWFSGLKLELIYNGIPKTDNSFVPDGIVINSINHFHSIGLVVIGCAGVLTTGKGFDQVIKLVHRERNLALTIFGGGKERSNLEGHIDELGIKDRCTLAGFKTSAVNYFRYFDFIIVPSRSEGFGLVMVEAVQQKVPVICSDIPVFRELFNENEVTFFKLDDQKSLSEAIKTAEEIGKVKSEMAYNRYLKNYTAELMAEAYHKLYQTGSVKHDNKHHTYSPEP